MIGKLIIFIKAVGLFLLKKENRAIGLSYTRKALTVANTIAKLTKTTKDDKAAQYMAEKIDQAIKINNQLDPSIISSAISVVNNTTEGDMKDVNIGFSGDGIELKVGKGKINYDPSNGGIKFGISNLLKGKEKQPPYNETK